MSLSVGPAATSPLSSWQQLLQQGGASGASKAGQSFDPLSFLMPGGDAPSSSADPSSSGSASSQSPFGPDMMRQLIDLQQKASAAGTDGASDPDNAKLFGKLDTDGDGKVSKSEFEAAASQHGISTSLSDTVFAKLDGDGDGSVGQSELAAAGKAHGHHGHGAHAGGVADASGSGDADDPTSGSDAGGTKTTTTTHADGSVTTTITYADGSTASTTSPPSGMNAGQSEADKPSGNGASGNGGSALMKELMALQSHLMSAAGAAVSAVI